MTETNTTRLGLRQWSSGSDGPSRDEFNASLLNLEQRAAIDRGAAGSALPTSGMTTAEYYQRTLTVGSDNLRTLYRTDSGSTWRAQNWIPEKLRLRPADATTATTEALRIDHPDVTLPGLTSSWDGQASIRSSLVLGASSDASLGRLAVGGLDAVPAGVRARVTAAGAERALELRAGDGSVTELLRAVDSAGSTVLTISSTQAAAFGATSPGAASLTGAPQPSGAQQAGILAYGLEAATSRAALQINRYGPGSSDPAAIMSVLPSAITIGRTGAWAGGQITLGAPTVVIMSPSLRLYPTAGDIAEATGFHGAGMDATRGLYSTFGQELTNSGATSGAAQTLRSYPSSASTWTGYLLQATQTELVSGSPASTEVARLNGIGQLVTNAPWRGSGSRPAELRDTRQSIIHTCSKIWVHPGIYDGTPLLTGPNGSFLYTWPSMTVRSASGTQLDILCRVEALYLRNEPSPLIARQTMQLRWEIQINGGSWTAISQGPDSGAVQEQGTLVHQQYEVGALTQDHWHVILPSLIAAGSTFRLRWTAQVANQSASAQLRRADLFVQESIINTYTPSE
jgi:hypothetical protein